ncbi:GA4 desaturase [Xylariaceae sp. FL0804]|nr:GA4 desaturase [Xylariaceae sp. FL0804]
MSGASPVLGRLRYVEAGHVPEPSPHNYHLPALSEFGDERLLPLHSLRPLPTVEELASATGHAQLHTHGFTAVHHPTTLHRAPHHGRLSAWKDPALLSRHYVPDTVDMMRRITGCRAVVTESLLLRSALWTETDALATHACAGEVEAQTPQGTEGNKAEQEDARRRTELKAADTYPPLLSADAFPQFIGFDPRAGGASPAPKVHQDYAPAGARTHIRKYHPQLAAAAAAVIRAEDRCRSSSSSSASASASAAAGYDGPRWALYSVWRPLRRVRRDPLALGDARTFADADYVPLAVKTPNLGLGPDSASGEEAEAGTTHDALGYVARWAPGHRWCWVPDQDPEEVLVIGLFDSAHEAEEAGGGGRGAGGALHSSVELPGREGEKARLSLELRCLCLW